MRYQLIMAQQETWSPLHQLATSTTATPDSLMQCFRDIIYSAAATAGYRIRTVTAGQLLPTPAAPHISSKHNVWHNHNCKQLQQQIRALPPHSTDPAIQRQMLHLERKYRRLVKKLVRKHRLEVGLQKLQEWRTDRNAFWRNYKKPGSHCPFSPQEAAEHFEAKMNSYAAPSGGEPLTGQPARAIDITSASPSLEEITAAVRSMKGSAAGIDGIPLTMLKPWVVDNSITTTGPDGASALNEHAAQAALARQQACIAQVAAALHAVFQCTGSAESVPIEWRTALLAPIYKGKGELQELSSYRPLSMPTVTCRVWSAVVNKRLVREVESILPDTMFGFRPERSCQDSLFILRHLQDMQRGKEGKIFGAAFMDLSGAYDSVDRELLFQKLKHKIGIAEHTLALLRSLYTNNHCTIKCGRSYSLPFEVRCGLRQGCPLSTTLFNLYIHDLHERIRADCKYTVHKRQGGGEKPMGVHCTTGPSPQQLTSLLLFSDLGYADDIALLADNPAHLQCIIDCFSKFCTENGLLVNPNKCEVMVFAGTAVAWRGHKWHAHTPGGDQLPLARVEKFKYLGVELHGCRNATAATQHRLSRMVAAQAAVQRRLREMQAAGDPQLLADLFETIVGPAGSYGCEVWSTALLATGDISKCPLSKYQASVYNHCLGIRHGGAAHLPAFFEMGRYPLQHQWLARAIRYWNKLIACQEGCPLLHKVLCANLQHGLGPAAEHARLACWSSELCTTLERIHPDGSSSDDWRGHMLALKPIEKATIMEQARRLFCQQLAPYSHNPSDPDCPHRVHCMYAQWMLQAGDHSTLPVPMYISAPMHRNTKLAMAQLRLGAAPLRANLERGRTPYSTRTCTRCDDPSAVDNEPHALLFCAGLADVREKHSGVLAGIDSFEQLMTTAYNPDLHLDLASYISDALKRIKCATGNHVGPRRGQGGLAG
jgi:hypothetical protein